MKIFITVDNIFIIRYELILMNAFGLNGFPGLRKKPPVRHFDPKEQEYRAGRGE